MINFKNDILFELLPLHQPIKHFDQMQGMDWKYDDHVWCKVKTTNIKNEFELGFEIIDVWATFIVIMTLATSLSSLVVTMKLL